MRAQLTAVDYHLAAIAVTNSQLAELSDQWTEEKIYQKTGVRERRIAADGEYASDLACQAAEKLFVRGVCRREDVDFLIYITQSPDQFLPAGACLLQDRLGIPVTAGAIDLNQGCSGFVYGLGVAVGLIESGQACGVLLLTGETYSRYIQPENLTVRTLFGDGGAAAWITATEQSEYAIGPFVHGTDGRGAPNLCVTGGGWRQPLSSPVLFMNGPEIFVFTMSAVPELVRKLLAKSSLTIDDIDRFVFHQANAYMLEHLRKKLQIPPEKFVLAMENFGNTTSSSIPIALRTAELQEALAPGMRVMAVGFGVGYSWSAALFRWPGHSL